ncbi:MAG: hypothetical protein IPM64_05935 [Phycisphaerales bacterium]|nr:hypothetical protein [Phycisphaerales bacterium]
MVARINNLECVIVPGVFAGEFPGVRLRIFRFHPCDPAHAPGGVAAPIGEISVSSGPDEWMIGTPLVLANERVVVQTSRRVRCFNLSAINPASACSGTLVLPTTPEWQFPADATVFTSEAASPATGKTGPGGIDFVVVVGRLTASHPTQVVVAFLNPMTGIPFHVIPVAQETNSITSCPAIGPIDDRPGWHFTFVTLMQATPLSGSPQLCSANVVAIALDQPWHLSVLRWAHTARNWGSPVLHQDGDLLLPSDDPNVHTFDNLLDPPLQDPPNPLCLRRRHPPQAVGSSVFSATVGVFPDRVGVTWQESGGILYRIIDGPSSLVVSDNAGAIPNHIGGAPLLDVAERFYMNTDGASRVYARKKSFQEGIDRFDAGWRDPVTGLPVLYEPPTPYNTVFHSQPAVTSDGTLICTNEGYVLALRPLLGDFNGDGCRSNFDVDPFADALMDLQKWREDFGDPIGINLVGIGDCNNDGEFNNFDIDCFVDLVVNHSGCPTGVPEESEPQGLMGGGGEGEAMMAGMSAFDEDDGPTCPAPDAHFWQTIARVRANFGD